MTEFGNTVPLAIFQNFGMMEILIVLLIVVLIFGARRLPELGRSLGEGIKNFKGSMKEGTQDSDSGEDRPGRRGADK